MLVLAYCAGLRLGEIARLDLGDVDLQAGTIAIRDTKFFKSRILPLAGTVVAALRDYVEARRQTGAQQDPASGLFWHDQGGRRYARYSIAWLVVDVLRRVGLKPSRGKTGPRIHDLRHSMVVNRITAWYRAGINPQARLPYLATYLGHRDINSTLTYITVTQDLLHQAGERFRTFGARCLQSERGGAFMKAVDPFPALLRAFFYDWMVEQRNASAHPVRSYRDTWRLFLRFVAERRRKTVAQLMLGEITAVEVSAFLHYTEQKRHDCIGTRNCRLAALRSFFGFVAAQEPAAAAQCAEVLRIPTKKAPLPAPCYLEPAEVGAILAQPDRSTRTARLPSNRDLMTSSLPTRCVTDQTPRGCPRRVSMSAAVACLLCDRGKRLDLLRGERQHDAIVRQPELVRHHSDVCLADAQEAANARLKF